MAKKSSTEVTTPAGAATEAPAKKNPCPITYDQWNANAAPLTVKIGETAVLVAAPKLFSTGSFGWYAGDKTTVMIDGVPVKVQVGLNLTVVGSKDVTK